METETIDRLYLELSQFTQAKTNREIELCKCLTELLFLVENGSCAPEYAARIKEKAYSILGITEQQLNQFGTCL